MKTIYLHGFLKERFGASFKLDVNSVAQAVSALNYQIKGFGEAVRSGVYHVVRGPQERGNLLGEDELTLGIGNAQEIHIVPLVAGSGGGKGGSIAKAITGYVLMAAGAAMFAIPGIGAVVGMAVISLGFHMVVGGVSGMMTKKSNSDYSNRGPADQRPSFLFNGAINSNQQGVPVPVVYGRMRVGSVVISSGITTEAV